MMRLRGLHNLLILIFILILILLLLILLILLLHLHRRVAARGVTFFSRERATPKCPNLAEVF